MGWLVSDLVKSSIAGSQIVQLGSCDNSQRRLETVNTEIEGSTELKAGTRQRLEKMQQAEKS